ncbi:MAG: PhnD/SsuA/transferrin family substrate-binding protein [Pseudomonadota bacterium]
MHRSLLALLWLLPWMVLALPLHAQTPVNIGVLAKRGEELTLSRWQPTADYLSREVEGYRFAIVPLGFEEIDEAVAAGRVDFVLANSGIYVGLEYHYGVGRIATLINLNGERGYTRFGGVIFTRHDRSDINTLADLRGKQLSAVKVNSFGGYQVGWRELAAAGIDPAKETRLSFAGTHDAVVYNVLRGLVDVGTVRTDTLERMQREGKITLEQVKVLHPQQHPDFDYLSSTRLYPEWPFASLRHTSESLRRAVASALLRMPPDSPAAKAGLVAGWTVPRNYQPVHELMRELRIGPYRYLGHISFEDLLRNYWHWLLMTLLSLLVLSAATLYFSRLNRRLRRTEGELVEARDHLAEKVQERTAELEQSRDRLARISRDWNDAFDAISDPIFIHDAQMRIVQANPAYCERAGHSLEEMVGKPYYHFFPRLDGPMPACHTFPELLHAQGDELELDSGEVFISRSFGIKRADNSVSHALHILEDVTELRRAEERRRMLSRALEQAGEGVLILDRERQVRYCNPGMGRLLGRRDGEADCLSALKDVRNLVAPPFVNPLLQLFGDADLAEGSAAGEMEVLSHDGGRRPVFITVGPIRDESGRVDGYVLTLLDMSEIKRAEQALTYRIGFESVIAEMASRLVGVGIEAIDAEIHFSLQQLGQFAGADRAYLFGYDSASDTISVSHEYVAEGVDPQFERLQDFPLTRMPWLRQRLLDDRAVRIPDVDAMPDEAAAEREEFQYESIRSMLIVPLGTSDDFSGLIGFDNVRKKRDWADEDVRLLRTAGETLLAALVRARATQRLERSQQRLATAQRIAHLGHWEWEVATGELSWSEEIFHIFGRDPAQFSPTYDAFLAHIPEADRPAVTGAVDSALRDGRRYTVDHRIVRPDGSERIVHEIGDVESDASGEPLRMIGTVQDVTELRRAEHEAQRLNRALRTLSLCNTALVHAEEETALVADICRILVEHGGYLFAWVGYAEGDERKSIRPVAHAGHADGIADSLSLSWERGETDSHPAGEAIRRVETVIVRDLTAESQRLSSWREAALARGYASVIALPLLSNGHVLGAITIDAGEPDAFDSEELRLLEEMAGDLAFGIRTLRSRRERERAEAALLETEQRFEALYENAPNGYFSISIPDGRLLQFNQALCDLLGYPREALSELELDRLYADSEAGLERVQRLRKLVFRGEQLRDEEVQMRHRDGSPIWVSLSVDPVRDEQGQLVEGRAMVSDISARKRAEEESRRFAEQLQRSLFQTIRAIALTIEKRDPYTAGHQERVAEIAVKIGQAMGLDEKALEGLRLGALIHDIGKISVPAEILNRPGRLEPEMFNIIKSHPRNGYEIISGIDFPWPLAEMVAQHHERLDGSGYPKGLKDGEILFEARILAVADVVEAMASHRPYRASLGLDTALEEIERGKGTIYDEQVADTCLKLFREEAAMREWFDSGQEQRWQ